MLIRSKLHRNGGTRVELGKGKDVRRYHFKPVDPRASLDDPDHEHVCDITNSDDVATFLAIREGYEVHPSELKKPAGAAAAKAAETAATAATQAAATSEKDYASMKKPDLIARIVKHPKFKGKAPHGTTPIAKLVEQLEKLDAAA